MLPRHHISHLVDLVISYLVWGGGGHAASGCGLASGERVAGSRAKRSNHYYYCDYYCYYFILLLYLSFFLVFWGEGSGAFWRPPLSESVCRSVCRSLCLSVCLSVRVTMGVHDIISGGFVWQVWLKSRFNKDC